MVWLTAWWKLWVAAWLSLPVAVLPVAAITKLYLSRIFRHALFNTIINSHQESVSGQASATLSISIHLFLILCDGGILRCPVLKWLLFHTIVESVFTASIVLLFYFADLPIRYQACKGGSKMQDYI